MERQFTRQAENALKLAKTTAKTCGHGYIGTEHLLAGLLKEPEGTAGKVLQEFNVEEEKLRELISSLVTPVQGNTVAAETKDPQYSPRARRIIEQAKEDAESMECLCGTEHLLLSLLKETDCVATRLLFTMGVNIQKLFAAILTAMGFDNDTIAEEFQYARNAGNKKVTSTPTLDQYSRDLTQLAAEGKLDPVIGRDKEITRLIQILSRRTKNNPCLTGEPGVGKTAIVEGLAQRIVMGMVPDTVKDKRLVVLDLSGMVAGSKYRGEFEERIKNVIQEVKEHQGILLFIDEIHTIIGAGGAEGALDASNILKPSLSRGEIQLIGATTVSEYHRHIEKDAALERRFQPVLIGEPDAAQTKNILRGLRESYENHHRVKITDEAIDAAVRLSVRYLGDRFLPDKAIDLIDEAAAKKRIEQSGKPEEIRTLESRLAALRVKKEALVRSQNFEAAAGVRDEIIAARDALEAECEKWEWARASGNAVIGENEIAETVTAWTHIPVSRISEDEGERLARLEEILARRVIGQERAVVSVSRAIRRGRAGLGDPKRPVGSFLFVGTTGVGKTELAKATAEALFGSENAMITLDMSEYMELHSVSKLIGSPPGYVGYGEGGQLTERVRKMPYCLILFDEIEKAHPDVFNLLLQVLEEGQLTDSQGRRAIFSNAVIIMTSNVGTGERKSYSATGFSPTVSESMAEEESIRAKLRERFRPEFLNRIDETVIFRRLGKDEIKRIAEKMLGNLVKKLRDLGVEAEFSDEAAELIAESGMDETYGARPLRREIREKIENVLAEKLLCRDISKGDKIFCTVKDGHMEFNKT